MSFSDSIRNHCIENYIKPARDNNIQNISIRAGDIHKEMNYRDRMPLVCSALGSNKFEEEANVKKLNVTGPSNGANAIFHFEILFS
jgi:5-methylcytosine-specific restriction protein B